MTVNVQWTATQNLSGTIELVQNGNVVASKSARRQARPPRLSATYQFCEERLACGAQDERR